MADGAKDGGTITAGSAIFARLKAIGVEYVFANSGTDFPPIIEGLAEAKDKGVPLPHAIVIPHEHAALGMAHGYYLVSGKAQAVMLHTNVGLANGATGAINAACENIPVYLMSGRTPVTEEGRFGARTVPIGWGQEMRDQTALVREACKWDYELRFPEQIAGLIDRAHAIANSTPKGPVYLSLPRETLCEPISSEGLRSPPAIAPSRIVPEPQAIRDAARLLAGARAPLVISQRGAGDANAFAAFSRWAETWGVPVCSWWATHLSIPTGHPCHVGADPGPWLEQADVVLVLNSLAPWWPDRHKLAADAKVIHAGPDPIFSRFPVRNFPSHLTLAGETADILRAIIAEMGDPAADDADVADRRARVATEAAALRTAIHDGATAKAEQGITKAHVSLALGEALEGVKSSVFSELGTQLGALRRDEHLSWFQEPHSGGLGWSFPAALGAQLADPDRLCVATMGDGSYMFANPTVCHQIADALSLPVLVVILNNEEWGAVRGSVMGMYPDGHASRANEMPLTALKPSPDFELTAQASGAWTRTVRLARDLPEAIGAALAAVRDDRRCALLNIKVLPD